MISTIFLITILLGGLSLASSTWFAGIQVFGARPDLVMLVLLWISFENDEYEGPVGGFLTGLLEDVLSLVPLGFHAFTRTIQAFLASSLHGAFRPDALVFPMVCGIGGTLLSMSSRLLLSWIFGIPEFADDLSRSGPWIEILLNALIAPFVFRFLEILRRYLVRSGKGSRG